MEAAVKERLEKLGVKFIFNAVTDNVDQLDNHLEDGKNIRVNFTVDEKPQSLEFSDLLEAVGRVPQTEGLRLDKAGVETGKGGEIVVDDGLRTAVKHIFAVGDVKGGPQFTFISLDDYRIILPQVIEIREGKPFDC